MSIRTGVHKKNKGGYYTKPMTIDPVTGKEMKDGILAYVPGKKYWGFDGGDWTVVFQEAFHLVADDKELQGVTTRIWVKLLAIMQYENFIVFSQKDLAEAMGIAPSTFSKSIKRLVEKNLLIKGHTKIGNTIPYRINTKFVWKGSKEAYKTNKDRSKKISYKELAAERWNLVKKDHHFDHKLR